MTVKRFKDLQTTPAPSEYFTGITWLDILVRNENIPCNVARVTFEPKSRNHWHTHPIGQILIATEGKGCVQKRGESIQILLPGDVVTILANEEHWHGASPDNLFTHIAIQLIGENGQDVLWLSPVTDEEYSSIKAS